jgi:hypothetical protein
VVDDPGRLEISPDRDEAALAEIEEHAADVDAAVGPRGEGDAERAGVERVATDVEVHRATLRVTRGPAQALRVRCRGVAVRPAEAGAGRRGALCTRPMRVQDAIAFVTGGASGLGEATVRNVLEGGGPAVIVDRPNSKGAELATALGDRATFAPADVTSEAEVQRAIDAGAARFGTINVVVNCAGIGTANRTVTKTGPFPLELFELTIKVNLIGTFNVIRLAAAQMSTNERNDDGDGLPESIACDGREVLLPSTPKSVSRETTIEGGTIDTEFLGGLIEYLSERIGSTLREYGKQARTIGLRIRYVDHFSAHQAVRISKPTNDERELLAAAKDLFDKLFTRRVAVRLVGVNVTNLETDRRQNELFDTNANRRWYLNRGLDSVRGRYGWNAVFYGNGLELREHYATKPNGLVLSTPCLSR